MSALDWTVLVVYLIGVLVFGLWSSGRQESMGEYFLGDRDLPWWAVCFSIVATETSTLTVIGLPAVAYLGTLEFLQITLGYLLGRILVSVILLNRYYRGRLETAYAFLGSRFGGRMRSAGSVTFLGTRLLADGVRLFATAIPLKVVAAAAGLELGYPTIIAAIGLATIAYTYAGGIKAVVWVDVVQMVIYLVGGVIALAVLLEAASTGWWTEAAQAGKTSVLSWGRGLSFSRWVTEPYTFVASVVGGAALTMASHGTDQLIVQRLLATRSLRDGQKALIGSAVAVMIQFALFLGVGLLLWEYYDGASLQSLGLTRGDEIFPLFVLEGLPSGISGLLIAAIVAAAMSTLSSSLNSLASSSVLDLFLPGREETSSGRGLRISRIMTVVWGAVFIGFASLFEDRTSPVIELGLSIASFTYGAMLGVFLLGLLEDRVREWKALTAFVTGLAVMFVVVFGLWYGTETGAWTIAFFPGGERIAERGLRGIAWPWYPVIGSAVTFAVGWILARGDPGPEPVSQRTTGWSVKGDDEAPATRDGSLA